MDRKMTLRKLFGSVSVGVLLGLAASAVGAHFINLHAEPESYRAEEKAAEKVYIFERAFAVSANWLSTKKSFNTHAIRVGVGGDVSYVVSQTEKEYIAGVQVKDKSVFKTEMSYQYPELLTSRYLGSYAEAFKGVAPLAREIFEAEEREADLAALSIPGLTIEAEVFKRLQGVQREQAAFIVKYGSVEHALECLRSDFKAGVLQVAATFKQAANGNEVIEVAYPKGLSSGCAVK